MNSAKLNDLYRTVHLKGFEAIDAAVAEVAALPKTEAVQAAREFGLRLPSGCSKPKAVAEIRRKLTEAKGSAIRISAI